MLSFSLSPGRALAIEGSNGAGKTSLLRAVAGFLRPDAGLIRLDGAAVESDHLHWLGHLDGLKGQRRASDELRFQADWLGGSMALDGAIRALSLQALLDLEVRQLSAGQRRRMALARFIAAPRPLWLLDEPLAPLDAQWREAVGALMQQHLDSGGLILAAVHDPLPITAERLVLGEGR
jgi:heme ABC exporter, ATP-binding protein CcmA